MTVHESAGKHACKRDGCTLMDQRAATAAGVPYRPKQPPTDHPKNNRKAAEQQARSAKHKAKYR